MVIIVTIIATKNDTSTPRKIRAKISRPKSSAPSQCCAFALAKMALRSIWFGFKLKALPNKTASSQKPNIEMANFFIS